MGRAVPLSVRERSGLERVRNAVVGRSMSRVCYWVLQPAPPLADLDVDRVHEVDSIEIGLDSGEVVRIRWAMAGSDEGLALEVDPDPLEAPGLEMIEVGTSSRWSAMLGHPVTQMRGAWHVSTENGEELLWAVSFRDAAGGELTVALGEVQDGVASYLPDSLVVLFSSAEAGEYEPLASRTSAWGEVIDPA